MLELQGHFIRNEGIGFDHSLSKLFQNNRHELDFETVITWQEDGGNCIRGGTSRLSFVININQATLLAHFSAGNLCIEAPSPELLWSFLSHCWQAVLDTVASLLWFHDDAEDLWWIEPAQAGTVWAVAMVRERQMGTWRGRVAYARSMEQWLDRFSPFASFLTRHNPTIFHDREMDEIATEELHEAASELLSYLGDHEYGMGLPTDFPFLVHSEWSVSGTGMIVKVHPNCLWFLCFPLDYFTVFPGIPGCYGRNRPEWIATGKPLSLHLMEKSTILKDLGHVHAGKTLIVINDYSFFHESGHYTALSHLLRRGMDLTTEILECCANDCSESHPSHSVIEEEIPFPNLFRWAKNPSAPKIRELLTDRDTWHVFANFHTVGQEWQTGGTGNAARSFNPGREFPSGELSHIRLMRIFHCHSMGDSAELGDLLSNRATLVQQLLQAGAWRVEGSYVEEDVIAFLVFVLRYLTGELGMQVACNCLEALGSEETGSLFQRVSEFIVDADYPIKQLT